MRVDSALDECSPYDKRVAVPVVFHGELETVEEGVEEAMVLTFEYSAVELIPKTAPMLKAKGRMPEMVRMAALPQMQCGIRRKKGA